MLANELLHKFTLALRDGSLKRVGILFTLDAVALTSRENLLEVNPSGQWIDPDKAENQPL